MTAVSKTGAHPTFPTYHLSYSLQSRSRESVSYTDAPAHTGLWAQRPHPFTIYIYISCRKHLHTIINNNNKRPLTPKSMPPAGDEHAKLKT